MMAMEVVSAVLLLLNMSMAAFEDIKLFNDNRWIRQQPGFLSFLDLLSRFPTFE